MAETLEEERSRLRWENFEIRNQLSALGYEFAAFQEQFNLFGKRFHEAMTGQLIGSNTIVREFFATAKADHQSGESK